MEHFTIEEFFANGHKNVEGLFILLSNSTDPEVREVLSNIKYDPNLRRHFDEIMEHALPIEIVSVENMLIDLTATTAYEFVKKNPLVFAFEKRQSMRLKPIEEITDYNDNLQVLKEQIKSYKAFLNSIHGTDKESDLMHFRTPESRKKYDNFQEFVNELSKFYTLAEKSKNTCFEKHQNFVEFSNIITTLNKKMISQLKTCAAKVAHIEDLGMGHAEQGVGVFNACADEWTILNGHVTRAGKKEKDFRDSVQAEIDKARLERSKIEPSVSPSEQARRDAINTANALYEELCQDFMRDLENQYALSSKDMYEYFVNVKFKNFVERFHMPLSSSTKIGTANDAAAQIRSLMSYVSKISENSYTTSVYPVEKQ